MQDQILTPEQIQAIPALADLPEEKVSEFVKVANNAAKQAIDTYSGTNKRRWEEDVKTLTGLEKPSSDMKAHEYLKWAWTEKMKEVDELKKQADGSKLKELNEQIETLQNKLNNSSSAWKQEADDYRSLVEKLKGQMQETESTYKEQLAAKERAIMLTKVQYDLANVESGMEFDPLISDDVRSAFIESKRSAILEKYTPEVIEKDGKTSIQWRDKNGELIRVAEKGMEPATTADLYGKELAPILKKSKEQAGAGSKPGAGGGSSTVDVRGAKTQTEATRIIEQDLVRQGLARGTKEFVDAKTKIWHEAEIAKLPLQ